MPNVTADELAMVIRMTARCERHLGHAVPAAASAQLVTYAGAQLVVRDAFGTTGPDGFIRELEALDEQARALTSPKG